MSHTLFVASYDVPVFDNLTALIALVVLSALLIFYTYLSSVCVYYLSDYEKRNNSDNIGK